MRSGHPPLSPLCKWSQAPLPHQKTQKQPVRLDELFLNGCGDGIFVPRKTGFAGAPFYLTASVAAQSGSLRLCGGTRRRGGSNPRCSFFITQKQPVRLDELFLNGCGDGIFVPRKTGFAGAPFYLTASVAAQSGSLRLCGGTRRRGGSNPRCSFFITQKQPVRLDELLSNGCGDGI